MSFISLTFWSISFILIVEKDPLVRFTGEPAPGADVGLFSMITSYKVHSSGDRLSVPFLSSALFLSNGTNSFFFFSVYICLSNRLYRLPRQDSHRIGGLITLFFIDDSRLFPYSRDRNRICCMTVRHCAFVRKPLSMFKSYFFIDFRFLDDSQFFSYSRDRRGKIVTGRSLHLLFRR